MAPSSSVQGVDKSTGVALARTHLETGLLYAEKFEQVTDSNILTSKQGGNY